MGEMSNEEHYRKLERMYESAPVNRLYQPVLHIEEGKAEVVFSPGERFFHAAGALHGSVCFKALDDAAFFAANSLVRDFFVVTASFQIYLTRPAGEGKLKAQGRVVHRSRRLVLADAELFDERGRQIARGSGCFLPSRIPLGPEIGYQ